MLDQVGTATSSRNRHGAGGRGAALTYVRMDMDYDPTAAKRSAVGDPTAAKRGAVGDLHSGPVQLRLGQSTSPPHSAPGDRLL